MFLGYRVWCVCVCVCVCLCVCVCVCMCVCVYGRNKSLYQSKRVKNCKIKIIVSKQLNLMVLVFVKKILIELAK